MKTNFKNKRAFTLIELLIVIAIIGILFIVLVSKVDFATDKAKASGVQTDFRSFQTAFEQVARENSGFATLGWDTGDDNGDRIRNSYDKGDNGAGGGIAQNGIQDGTEVFVGSKTYGEEWTGTYALVNPDNSKDSSAFVALENAINSNLDPKLHITITPNTDASGNLTGSAAITMANQARDPWKNEYAGAYITNATVDSLDRGTIIMYSTGANGKLGVNYSVSGGLVGVEVPGSNINGKDDYVLSVTYSYANGYGEVQTGTAGFSNNQNTLTSTPIVDNGVNAGGMSAGTGSVPGVVTPSYSEGLSYVSNGDGTCLLAGRGTCTDVDIVIPDYAPNGDKIVGLVYGGQVFSNDYARSIVLNHFIKYIETDEMCDLPNLESVTFLTDEAGIYFSFFYCPSLKSITVPANFYVNGYALVGCEQLVINYKGTMNQWNELMEDDDFAASYQSRYVQCSDGMLDLWAKDGFTTLYIYDGKTASYIEIGHCPNNDSFYMMLNTFINSELHNGSLSVIDGYVYYGEIPLCDEMGILVHESCAINKNANYYLYYEPVDEECTS